jgi:anti-sigma factor RsiW
MVLLVQADFDGELDAAQATSVEAHRANCPVCQTAYADLHRVRETLRAGDLYYAAPDALRRKIAARADTARRPQLGQIRRNDWLQRISGFGVGAAVAAAIAVFMIQPGEKSLVDEVVADHVRSLQPGHLMDVISTDRHTVKPWFDGRLDFAPPVRDLKDQGFPLEGGRLDYLNGRPVAALVYGRAKHEINLFIWPVNSGDAAEQVSVRNGYNVIHFTKSGMDVWAVSDLEKGELSNFVRLWQAPA